MKQPVTDARYEHVPPYRGRFWSWLIGACLPVILRSQYGITGWNIKGLHHIRDSLEQGHGIVLCPNHSRTADPLLGGVLTTALKSHGYGIASWHVFRRSRLDAFVLRRAGAFSIYREGTDRQALSHAIDIVGNAERPLYIFPEGMLSTSNDHLLPLLPGTALIARQAARRRRKHHPGGKVVIHPIAYRYQHRGDPDKLLRPVLSRMEEHVFGEHRSNLQLLSRVRVLRLALQSAREIRYLGKNLGGSDETRMQELSRRILCKHERAWFGQERDGQVHTRIKDLRTHLLPELVEDSVTKEERTRRWRCLDDLHFAHCNALHPIGYLDGVDGDRLVHRLFETVERLEEELFDTTTNYHDLTVLIDVGEAIEVDPDNARRRGSTDPLMKTLRDRLLVMLSSESGGSGDTIRN